MKTEACLKTVITLALMMLMRPGAASLPVQAQNTPGTVTLPVVSVPDIAPVFKFTHLTTADGLSHDHIYAVSQDRQGFMWFATRDGLNRYDGNTFVVFKNNPDDPATISGNFIQDLLEDARGYLVCWQSRLILFEPTNGADYSSPCKH